MEIGRLQIPTGIAQNSLLGSTMKGKVHVAEVILKVIFHS